MLPGQYVLLSLAVLFFVLTLRGRSVVDRAYRSHVLGWILLWLMGGLVVLFPDVLSRLAEFLGIGRGVDVVLYVGFMFMAYMLFRVLIRLYVIEREITTLVREITLKDVDEKK